MQYLKIHISLILIALFFSCNTGNHKKSNTKNELIVKSQMDSINPDSSTSLKSVYFKLSALRIKSDFGITSETIERSYYSYHLFNSTGVYGRYYLLNPDTIYKMPFVGELIIFTNNRPWKASDTSENLVELISYTSIIPLNDDIFVGQQKDTILKKLGAPQLEVNNILFYHDTNTFVLALKIKSDTVNAFRFGYYEANVELNKVIQDTDAKFKLRCL